MTGDLIKSVLPVDQVVREAAKYVTHRARRSLVRADSAIGKVLAEDIYALIDVPPFDRAVVDGFAVRAEDTLAASPTSPVVLRITRGCKLGPGEAKEVSTGDPLPEGANAVVMYEHAVVRGDVVEVLRPVQLYANVSRRGEDFRKGELVVPRGRILTPIDIAAVVAAGHKEVEVFQVRAALICTGDEVRDVDEIQDLDELSRGLVLNTTRFVVEEVARRLGIEVVYVGRVPDDEKTIQDVIAKSLQDFDIVITTGGLAVGKRDVTYRAVLSLKPEFTHRGLAIRPGRPTGLAVVQGKPIVMLSGFPVAAYVGAVLLLPEVMKMITGLSSIDYDRCFIRGVLTRRVTKPPHLRAFIRVHACLDESGVRITPLALTGSGLLSTLLRGNAMLVVPEGLEGVDENEVVEVELLRGLHKCS